MEVKRKNEQLEMELKQKNEALDAKEAAWKTKVGLQINDSLIMSLILNFKLLQKFDILF